MVEKASQQQPVISAKEEILNRIRGALGARKAERESDYAYIPRQYHVAGARSENDRLALFIDRLHDYGASVFPCREAAVAEAVGAALSARNLRKLLHGKGFPGGWIPAGFDFVADFDFPYDRIDSFDGVITPCAIGIAETGTIVLRHADDEARRSLSLIPDYHLCIVFASQVVETVPEGVREMAAMGDVPLTTISGPSATSDIEMTRVKGVHGPRTLDVILVYRQS
jgi:L-lactate dehydrogenase complex protein LldG